MTVREVKRTILRVRQVMDEWDEVDKEYYPGQTKWREAHTRYAFIDPIIRALGWDMSDPKECHPEYFRPFSQDKRVDYAMFREPDSGKIGTWQAVPDIIIEAKAVGNSLIPSHVDQLQRYVRASPRMVEGVAVLTNGEEWRLYKADGRRSLSNVECETVKIRDDDPQQIAEVLHSLLKRERSN